MNNGNSNSPKKGSAETIQRFNIQVNNLTQVSIWPMLTAVYVLLF